MFKKITSIMGDIAQATALILYFTLHRVKFRYLAHIASSREIYIRRLLTCIFNEFEDAGYEITALDAHIGPLPGYDAALREKGIPSICWETPVGIIVCGEDKKQLFGIGIEFFGPVLHIRQLQGVPGVQIPDTIKHWPKLLVKAGMNFLYNTEEFTSIRVYSADQRIPYWRPSFENVTSLEDYLYRRGELRQALRRRYDKTAKKLGFGKHVRGYWEWDLSMLKQKSGP